MTHEVGDLIGWSVSYDPTTNIKFNRANGNVNTMSTHSMLVMESYYGVVTSYLHATGHYTIECADAVEYRVPAKFIFTLSPSQREDYVLAKLEDRLMMEIQEK